MISTSILNGWLGKSPFTSELISPFSSFPHHISPWHWTIPRFDLSMNLSPYIIWLSRSSDMPSSVLPRFLLLISLPAHTFTNASEVFSNWCSRTFFHFLELDYRKTLRGLSIFPQVSYGWLPAQIYFYTSPELPIFRHSYCIVWVFGVLRYERCDDIGCKGIP